MDESDLLRKFLRTCRIVFGNEECGPLDGFVDLGDHGLEEIQVPLVIVHHPLPVPLVNVDGVDVVDVIVRTDGVHVGVKTRARCETVVCQGHALPFCKALHDLHRSIAHVAHGEADRPLDAVEVIVDTAVGTHEERGCDARKLQLTRKLALEGVLDELDRPLCQPLVQKRPVVFGNDYAHGFPLGSLL